MKSSILKINILLKLIWNIFSVILLSILKVILKILHIICFLLAYASIPLGFRPFIILFTCNIFMIAFIFLIITASAVLSNSAIDPTFTIASLFFIIFSSVLCLMGKWGKPILLFTSEKCGDAFSLIPITFFWIPLSQNSNTYKEYSHTSESQSYAYYNEYSHTKKSQENETYEDYSHTRESQSNDNYEEYTNANNSESNDTSSKYSHAEKSETASNLFAGITTKESLKKRYRDLLKIYHPDNSNGNTQMTQLIHKEYEELINKF